MPSFNKQRNNWQGKVTFNLKPYTKSFQTKKEAKAWEIAKLKQLKNPKPKIVTVCLIDLATDYLDFAEKQFTNGTYVEKKKVFKRLFAFVPPETRLDDIEKKDSLKFFQFLSSEVSGHAANKARKNLVAAWNWGVKYLKGVPVVVNPFDVDRQSEERKPRYVPPIEDLDKVLSIVDSFQDEVMLMCYIHLAARRSEVFRLSWDDVDFANQQIRLGTRKRKGGSMEYDWLPMTDTLFDYMLEWRQRSSTQEVFISERTKKPFVERRQWMKGLCKRAEVKHFGLHGIRHLSAVYMHRNGVPVKQIQRVLRHKDIKTTDIYLQSLEAGSRETLQIIEGLGNGKHRPVRKQNSLRLVEEG